MTTHQFTASHIVPDDHSPHLNVDFILPRVPGRYGRYQIGWSPEGTPGRQVFQGPQVEELFGFIFERATCIAAHPIARDPGVEVEWNDTIEVEGVGTFRVLAPVAPWVSDPKVEVVR